MSNFLSSGRTWTVAQRLIVLCVAALTIFAVSGVVTFLQFSSIESNANQLANANALNNVVADAQAKWLTDDDAMNMFAALKSLKDSSQNEAADAQWKGVQDSYAAAIKDLQQARTIAIDKDEVQEIEGMISDLPKYQAFTDQMYAEIQRGDIRGGIKSVTVDNADISASLQDRYSKFSEKQVADAAVSEKSVHDAVESGRIIAVVIAIAGGVLVGILGFVIASGIGRALRRTNEATTSSVQELSAVASQMSSSAQETAGQTQMIAAASEELSVNLSAVAAAVDEMQASVAEIARSAGDASTAGTDAVATVNATNARVSALGEASHEIGQVLDVITSIAEQTNLLALNATIEAARAGDAGKGFAVVANEVKDLAKETATATEQIAQRIQAIQSETDETTSAIMNIADVITRINDMQGTIAAAVEEQTATTVEIARNVSEAATGSSDIASNIASVSEQADTTSTGARTTQDVAGAMSQVARELDRLVNA